ncbi:TPA: PapB/FocB family fimbrial expression transcriptional regulator [Escherichia coli]|uniref:PapB/FocB family fimbrial expression transcriptional regulator n=1 Tax=Escherichia coli TaxID=562 RepID=UPI00039134E3|nr:PapB/FocB family fimbrial expression transcriptional regulator [Escherichia coli]EFM0080823.1 transcriptional regulator [Escherichia coli]EIJ2997531.1 transcriptional regulator [Escherichia coli]ERB10655.1 hypothetical protein G918_04766 [Escherichia coli UMEA 3150-1]MCU6469380.1 adhesin biosynthesis transcription regulatory family protein [Escherichia coli]HBE4395449.1 transcriptional regulator [Escherichia coli]
MLSYGKGDVINYPREVDNFAKGGSHIEGRLSAEQFDLLIELSSIHSQKVILAMRDHLVNGDSRRASCERHGVNAGYLSVCIRRLLQVEKAASKLAHFY